MTALTSLAAPSSNLISLGFKRPCKGLKDKEKKREKESAAIECYCTSEREVALEVAENGVRHS